MPLSPAPWSVGTHEGSVFVYAPGMVAVACCGVATHPDARDDAALLAAAPELRDALAALLGHSPGRIYRGSAVLAAARAALAKATNPI